MVDSTVIEHEYVHPGSGCQRLEVVQHHFVHFSVAKKPHDPPAFLWTHLCLSGIFVVRSIYSSCCARSGEFNVGPTACVGCIGRIARRECSAPQLLNGNRSTNSVPIAKHNFLLSNTRRWKHQTVNHEA